MNLIDMIGPIENSDPDQPQSHVVLLWGRDDLLSQSIGSFLDKLNWNVVRVSNDGNVDHLIQEVRRVRPAVVILCQETEDGPFFPWRLIDERLCRKVLTVRMDSNVMHIYSRQDVLVQGTDDLLSVINPEHLPNLTVRKEVGSET